MPTRFAIWGDGAWGTAIALLLAQSPRHHVTLWSAREESGRLLRENRENARLLPDVPISEAVRLTTDSREAAERSELGIIAIPTIYLRETLPRIAEHWSADKPVLSLTKGLENETFLRPTEIIQQILGVEHVAALSGPSHAEEVSRGMPASLVAASADIDLAQSVQQALGGPRFRIYTSQDLIGVELAGALKNIVGIAAGISDGLGFGDNAKAALLTRGLVEIARFGVALGAEHATFFGLAGLGDLITTCISEHGRNRRVGERLARGEKLSAILQSMSMVAEGVYTTRSVHERASRMGIDMPITTEVFRVLYADKDPRLAVSDLMLREPRGERLV